MKRCSCLRTELRAGNVYTSRQVVRFVGPILTCYEKWIPTHSWSSVETVVLPFLNCLIWCKSRVINTSYVLSQTIVYRLWHMADPLLSSENLHKPPCRRTFVSVHLHRDEHDTAAQERHKIAGRLVHSGRYWTWKLCNSCVYQKEFIQTLHNVTRIPQFR